MTTTREEQEMRFSKTVGFFDTSLMLRISVGFIFCIGLFLFLHFREVRVDFLELNSTAPKYVVASIDFAFPDEEATAVLRQEALLDIGKIFSLDADGVKKKRLEFENYLIYDQAWRKTAQLSTFDEMCKASQRLARTLEDLRFTDARTFEKMQSIHFPTNNYIELAPPDVHQNMQIPEAVWREIQQKAFEGQHFHEGTIPFVMNYFSGKSWIFKEDITSGRKLKRAVYSKVPTKYTEVFSGSRIIDQGERVTNRHLMMIQAMKKALSENRNLWSINTLAGSLLITLLVVVLCYLFLQYQYTEILLSNRLLFLLVTIFLLGIGFAKITEFLLLRSKGNLFELIRYPLLTPFIAILTCSLVNPGVAVFIAAVMSVFLDGVLACERHGLMVVNLLVALFAVLFTRNLRRRTEIFSVCGKAWIASVLLITGLYLYDPSKWGGTFFPDIVSAGVFMLVSAVLVVGLLPLLESLFRILTDVTLMEYMDPNHELLRRLTIEAPGTYQHSLIMGNIAEAAAREIGANGLFCRVATLYHDIGKINIAQYFTENQQLGVNIHQLLTPVESAQVIMSHVREGVALARKAGLPEQFVDIIKEHHGTSLVYYFYHKQLEKMEGSKDLVNEKEFRYPGPRPHTKESVVIMIADSVEAASRSLDEISEDSVKQLVERIVQDKLEDGQFNDSMLTFEELGRIKRAIIRSLLSIGHLRVKYPQKQ